MLAIHDRQIAEHGASANVRDEGLLESALARPRERYAYGEPAPDLADLSAGLAYRLARNHPFMDGNKRTAAVCCEALLEPNGAVPEAEDLRLYPQYLALTEGRMASARLAAWPRAHLERLPRSKVRGPRARDGARCSGTRRTRSRAGARG